MYIYYQFPLSSRSSHIAHGTASAGFETAHSSQMGRALLQSQADELAQ